MAVSKELLDMLCCPETKEEVSMISEEEVARINQAIEKGTVLRRNGEKEDQPIEAGLLRKDGKYLYPIRADIPVMLIDEAIDMSSIK